MDELTVNHLADVLQEPNRPLLRQVLRTLGQDRCAALLVDALQCEANGGMRTMDGTRQRTPGGVFFQLVKERTTARERRRLFPRPAAPHSPVQQQTQPQALPQIIAWDEVQTLIETLATAPAGEARTM